MSLIANWSYPNAIRFGAGGIRKLAEACDATNMRNPLVVTDKNLARLPMTSHMLELLQEARLGDGLFSDVDPNPDEKNLNDALRVYKDGHHDGVIAFGGGSSLDVGKMVAFMSGQTRPVWDFDDGDDRWKQADPDGIAPIIAIPTTAGTGSEVGRASVITNSEAGIKKIIFHPKVLPEIAIIDPELTVGMPKPVTAGTGMDAFAHCLEAFCSPHYHPMSQGIALEGMRLVKENLVEAYTNGTNLEARSHMMSAAMMGAVAFQKGLGAIHALSHPLGAVHHIHHGTTNAICMQTVLEFNRPAIENKMQALAKYLDIGDGFDDVYRFVGEINTALNIPKSLTEFGVKNPDIDQLTRAAIKDPSAGGNPVRLNQENTRSLFEKLLAK